MSSTIERKLAAIMFTDIAGFTSQMSKDQDVALSLLDTKRKALKPLIQKHKGTLVKEMGDGTLSHFPSAIDATNCSLDLQKSVKDNNDLNIRIGVHLGDTSFRDDDVFGDGVNIASRLEKMSPPGGVLVSKNVYDELSSRKGYNGISLGLQQMKGVGRLVEVFGLKDEHLNVPKPSDYTDTKIEVHKDKEVPSIAIIPFENKGAEEDVFYSYGISADLISDVSSAGLIRVPSLKRVEEVSDLSLDEKARKLDVRYTVEGTLWKMDDMFQLSVELYDTKDKKVVWSDRWQEHWNNLPTIKGSLSEGLLKSFNTKPKIDKKVETTNPEAYEFYLQAKYKYEKRENTDDTEITRALLNKAIKMDENLIVAKALLGSTYREIGEYDMAMEIFITALKQAEELNDKKEIGSNLNGVGAVYYNKGDYDTALDYYERSLAIRKELGDIFGVGISLNNIGMVYNSKGGNDKAIEFYERALAIHEELGEKRGIGYSLHNIGMVYSNKGDYENAIDYCKRSLTIREELGDKYGVGNSLNNIGVVYYRIGDYEKAIDYYERALSICEELGNKQIMGNTLANIGVVFSNKGDYENAIKFYERALAIHEELVDKYGVANSLHNIGVVYYRIGDYEKAIDYYEKALAIDEGLGEKRGKGYILNNIGIVYVDKGDYNKALDYYKRSLTIREELGDKYGMVHILHSIGIVYAYKSDNEKAQAYLEKSLIIQKEIGLKTTELDTTTNLYLSYKHIGKEYDAKGIYSLIKETENIEFELNLKLYQLLEDRSYLETAYNQVQEKASAMDDGAKFLKLPIPKAIVEEYNKVFKT